MNKRQAVKNTLDVSFWPVLYLQKYPVKKPDLTKRTGFRMRFPSYISLSRRCKKVSPENVARSSLKNGNLLTRKVDFTFLYNQKSDSFYIDMFLFQLLYSFCINLAYRLLYFLEKIIIGRILT